MTSILTLLLLSLLQQTPQRDAPARPTTQPVGTASVSGVVLTDGDTPQPVRFASVVLSEGLLSLPRIVVSDEEGRFTIADLPEGSYTLTTQKPAWVPLASSVRTGQGVNQGGIGQGVPVAVKAGEAVRGITLRMAKGAVISGVVRLPGGRPAAGMSVQVLRTSRVDGKRSATMSVVPGTTDDQGRYRVYGLEAGEYVVQVRTSLLGMASLMGAAADTREVLPSEVRWAEATAAMQAAAAAAVAPPPPPDLGPTVTYTTTYYPGTVYLSDAAGLLVRPGEERLNIDFEIKKVPTTTVSGSVIGLDGSPAAGAMVSLNLPAGTGQEDMLGQLIGASRTTTRADGTFVMNGVPPGNYQIVVRAAPPKPADPSGRQAPPNAEAAMAAAMAGAMAALGGGGANASMSLWARESISVDGLPVGPMGLQLREGLTVAGSIVFEGEAPTTLTNVRVTMAEPAASTGLPDIPMFRPGQSAGQVKPDFSFEIAGAVPAVYQLGVVMPGLRTSLTTPGEGWVIKSARHGDRDVMDGGLDLTGGSGITGLVVTMTRQPSEISGRVLDAASQPFSAFPLVIFSADRAHWTAGSRRVQYVQPATNGSYVFAGLPAGKYYLAAVTELDTKELASAAFLESLIGSAITVTLADGERKVQDVKLAGGQP